MISLLPPEVSTHVSYSTLPSNPNVTRTKVKQCEIDPNLHNLFALPEQVGLRGQQGEKMKMKKERNKFVKNTTKSTFNKNQSIATGVRKFDRYCKRHDLSEVLLQSPPF